MPRPPKLTYDRGTLLLHPPPRGKAWVDLANWDDRVEKFRIPAYFYRPLVERLQAEGITFVDEAKGFQALELVADIPHQPFEHQQSALIAWKQAQRQGVIVLPTAAGKTLVAHLAIASTPRSTLILVPTLDLMHQWYEQLLKAFPVRILAYWGAVPVIGRPFWCPLTTAPPFTPKPWATAMDC